jgi:hypothetical protein
MKVCVLGIIGTSYCGSTLLDVVLNSHPKVTGIGEAYRLVGSHYQEFVAQGQKPRCYICGDDCRVFPAKGLPLTFERLHRNPAERMRVQWVVDSSKVVNVFRDAEKARSADAYCYVILIKRPEPALGSFIKHRSGELPVNHIVKPWLIWYEQAERFVDGRRFLVLPYDELCSDPQLAVRRVHGLMNATARDVDGYQLGWAYDFENFRDHETHRVDGNLRVLTDGMPIAADETWRKYDVRQVPEADRIRMWAMYYRILDLRQRGFLYD